MEFIERQLLLLVQCLVILLRLDVVSSDAFSIHPSVDWVSLQFVIQKKRKNIGNNRSTKPKLMQPFCIILLMEVCIFSFAQSVRWTKYFVVWRCLNFYSIVYEWMLTCQITSNCVVALYESSTDFNSLRYKCYK